MEGFNVNKVEKKDGYIILNIKGFFNPSDIFSFVSEADIVFGTYSFSDDGKIKSARIVITRDKGLIALNEKSSFIKGDVETEEEISLILVKGMGLSHNADVLIRFYEALYDLGIEVKMISKGETKILAVVDKSRAEDAYIAVSKGLYGM